MFMSEEKQVAIYNICIIHCTHNIYSKERELPSSITNMFPMV